MNFIIYNETTGLIEQTGYTLWDAPAASPEYIALSSEFFTLNSKFINEQKVSKQAREKWENYLEGVSESRIPESDVIALELITSNLSVQLREAEDSLALLIVVETESYNEAKEVFLASLCTEGQTAIEGIADASVQKVQISDKTLISREPDPIPFGNINRSRRDSLLNLSDWTQVPDSPLSSSAKESWKVYRAALRDLSDTLETFETAELSYSDLPERPE